MQKKHALLSASGASRWMTCTPSAKLEEKIAQQYSAYADEGTLAHELCEALIREHAFGIPQNLKSIQDDPLYSEEMFEYATQYALFVVDQVRNAPQGAVLIQEQRLNLTSYIPDGFGTTDVCIVADGTLEVIDFKYGKGVPVDSFENKQMMVYALGALDYYSLTYNIDHVRMTIYQPRIDNVSTYEMSASDLLEWGHDVLKPTALKAYEGIGTFIPGDHCRFCRARSTCSVNAKFNLAVVSKPIDVNLITDEQLVKIAARAVGIKNWLNSIEEMVLKQAVAGKKWPGLKLVAGRSTRKYLDEEALLKKLEEGGYKREDFVNKKIIGITELSKKLPILDFAKFVEPLLVKPPGSPTLVSEDDKRPELNANSKAAEEFGEVKDEN